MDALPRLSKADLKRWVFRELRQSGFRRRNGLILPPDPSKENIRRLHLNHRKALLSRSEPFIREWEELLIKEFADGDEVRPGEINPQVVQVKDDADVALFRYASLLWSVPVSQGYGRRTRFLVRDRSNDKLIGIFALGDPVFNLTARDQAVGWNARQRTERLYNVLDAYVLGAVPPYRELIGGKLVAMAAVSDDALDVIARKYRGSRTIIKKQLKSARPVLITTTSSMGRSSIYNRLKFEDRVLYVPKGWTQGYGHFHFSTELFDALVTYAKKKGDLRGNEFGAGPNWRMRTLREALKRLGLEEELLRHGIPRQVFLAPVASNWESYLRGEKKVGRFCHFALEDMSAFYRERWAVPRAARDPSFKAVVRDSSRLTQVLP